MEAGHEKTLMGNDEVEKKPDFTKWLLNFIFNEGHCISGDLEAFDTDIFISETRPFYIAFKFKGPLYAI